MKESEVDEYRRAAVYQGVVRGGEKSWRQNDQELKGGWAKIAPPEWRDFPAGISWRSVRMAMRDKGIRDPLFVKNQPFCKFGNSTAVPNDPQRPSSFKYEYDKSGNLVSIGIEKATPPKIDRTLE